MCISDKIVAYCHILDTVLRFRKKCVGDVRTNILSCNYGSCPIKINTFQATGSNLYVVLYLLYSSLYTRGLVSASMNKCEKSSCFHNYSTNNWFFISPLCTQPSGFSLILHLSDLFPLPHYVHLSPLFHMLSDGIRLPANSYHWPICHPLFIHYLKWKICYVL